MGTTASPGEPPVAARAPVPGRGPRSPGAGPGRERGPGPRASTLHRGRASPHMPVPRVVTKRTRPIRPPGAAVHARAAPDPWPVASYYPHHGRYGAPCCVPPAPRESGDGNPGTGIRGRESGDEIGATASPGEPPVAAPTPRNRPAFSLTLKLPAAHTRTSQHGPRPDRRVSDRLSARPPPPSPSGPTGRA